jgi:glucosyl-dolichyl phosphate glucuronosyltransferase
MSLRSFNLTIIIPTKDRAPILRQLLDSIRQLADIPRIRPEIVVADNNSCDETHEQIKSVGRDFPATIRVLKVTRPGKSAALNDALKTATGNVVAFLDDDVAVDKTWLTAVKEFFTNGEYKVGQGTIRIPSPEKDEPEILALIERYRTIPTLEYKPALKGVHSLNGANFFVAREVIDRVGGFDERLGPGAAGTSEDVDFAHRLAAASIAIGYAPQAIVYHRVDRHRLTEAYFKQSHRCQGGSRFLIHKRGRVAILFDLARAVAGYAYYSLIRKERARYRSKGRIYHYLGMMEAKKNHTGGKEE